MKLDYSISNSNDRVAYIDSLLKEYSPTSRELELISNYILAPSVKIKDKTILSDNRMVTINKRETSFQGLSDKLEGGEDAVSVMIRNDKQTILSPKKSITEEDLQTIPELRELKERISYWEKAIDTAPRSSKFKIKKMLIEMRKEQYTIKQCNKGFLHMRNTGHYSETASLSDLKLTEFSHVVAILNNYTKLKQYLWDNLKSDTHWTLMDLENIIDNHLKPRNPLFYDILIMKIDEETNEKIQHEIQMKYGRNHSQEYISSLWKNKIPEMIVELAKDLFLNWVYTYKLKGNYKTCSKCRAPKLAHKRYFSTNKAAKYGFYSVCKECRNG